MPLTAAAEFLARLALREISEDVASSLGGGETVALDSTCLSAMTYDPESEALDLDFVSGHSFSYLGVPQDVAVGLLTAASPGGYYNSEIKGKY